MKNGKRVLVAPLDWGLGHASRCIPIIRELIDLNVNPVLAGDGNSLALLKMEFPDLEFLDLPNLPIEYPLHSPFSLHFATKVPAFNRQVKKEHDVLAGLLVDKEIDAIISDNRYGLYLADVPNIIITHQLNVMAGPLSKIASNMVQRKLANFDHIWVPDWQGQDSLAGKLSACQRADELNVTYIGPLSRFSKEPETDGSDFDFLAVLSGPEPHRSLFEKRLLREFGKLEQQCALVRGTRTERPHPDSTPNNVRIFDLIDQEFLQRLIAGSRKLIFRCAYSSVMDLVAMERTALLVPTPGQGEQEYLSEHLTHRGYFPILQEKNFNTETAAELLNSHEAKAMAKKNQHLREVLADFLSALY